ncbi:Signal transduction histidine kinase [Tranquillimonas rosea]|uniref:histidine kinase n=1 Tax=Tranquillimonas rosea TaxID=641238 RepID=A0A1H9TSE5_9RHOB|nr:GAF domain-containing sensor histidine kinase [Tranquillimonas rosea]SER99927.1 Signal transduction histidine kinase [Tranquillimonas rosea]
MGVQSDSHAFERLALLDTKEDPRFDNITSLAARLMDVPISLISIIDDAGERQFFRSARGLPDSFEGRRETPLRYSFCRHVRDSDVPLVAGDTREAPELKGNPAIEQLGLYSYLGVPIHGSAGGAIGALCCIGHETRTWRADEVQTMRQLGACVDDLVALRIALVDRRAAQEAAEEASRRRATFFSHVSHEMRTPLTGILGAAQLLPTAADNRKTELTDVIVRSSQRLRSLLNDLLDLAKIEAGGMGVHAEALDIAALAREAVGLHQAAAEGKGLDLVVETAPAAERPILLDRKLAESILHNLLSNAVKFTDAGSIVVNVGVAPDGRLRLVVRDTGIGIAAEHQGAIFEEFEQADPVRARSHGGTGLGMALVKRFAELMGGAVHLESAPDAGTTVTVFLPRQEA